MDWLEIAQQLMVAATLAAVGWLVRSLRDIGSRLASIETATDDRLDVVEGRMIQVEELERHNVIDRLTEVERQQSAAVTREQLGRIHERIDAGTRDHANLAAEIAAVAGEVKAVHRSVTLIQQHLIGKGGTPS